MLLHKAQEFEIFYPNVTQTSKYYLFDVEGKNYYVILDLSFAQLM